LVISFYKGKKTKRTILAVQHLTLMPIQSCPTLLLWWQRQKGGRGTEENKGEENKNKLNP
jgi:hypothetical protein